LAKMHTQLGNERRIVNYAEHGEFSTALKLYREYVPDEKSDDTRLRDMLGTLYWDSIKKGGKEKSREEVEAYLEILRDERNQFPDSRKKVIEEAIDGLKKEILSVGRKKIITSPELLSSRATHSEGPEKKTNESDKQFVARLGRRRDLT
jgi:hypothetical protein